MASLLKEFSLALGLLASDPQAMGEKLGLHGYVWSVVDVAPCQEALNASCRILSSRWDWKRPQYFEVSLRPSQRQNVLNVRMTLKNADPADTDQVCFFMIAVSRDQQISGAAFHTEKIRPQQSMDTDFSVPLRHKRPDIRRIQFGSKQCDETLGRDRRSATNLMEKLSGG